MNIMKTNMLLLDNKMIKEDAGSTTVTPAPVPSEDTSKAGMKALSFLGMKNLMANPKLAQGVGVMNDTMAETNASNSYVAPFSSNVAFKGGAKNVAKLASFAALATMAAAALQSCDKDHFEVKTEQTVIVDTEALAAAITNGVASLKLEIETLKLQLAQKDAEQAERDQQVIAALTAVINQLTAMNTKIDNQGLSFEEFKYMIYGQNSAILDAIVLLQNITKEEAQKQVDRILEAYKNGVIDIKTAMAQLQELLKTNNELLSEILVTLKNLEASAEEANLQREVLLDITSAIAKYQKISVNQQQIMIKELCTMINQNNSLIYNQQQTINAIYQTGASLQASIYDVANQLGVKVDYLAQVIAATGASIENVLTMSKGEILQVLQANLAELQNTNNRLIQINDNVSHVDISVQDNTGEIIKAAEEITDLLNKISGQLDALSAQFADAVKIFRGKLDKIANYAKGCFINGQINNSMLASLNKQIFDLKNDVRNIKATAIEIRNNIENGVAVDMDQLEEFFKILNMHQTESKDEIIAKLNQFIASQENLEAAINKLGNENNSRLEYIASLIKNKSADNADVIEAINNLAQSNEENITAATEALAAKLDALIAKVDAILNKMGDIVPVLKQYGDQIIAKFSVADDILEAIKANGKKIDISNMTLDQLKAELEKIKPELQKLNNSATTANSYLDIIAKRQLEIKQAINDIDVIGGNGGITKEELEELWNAHDAKAYATAKAYLDAIHAEDIGKADTIIELMKKGNKTAGDTYQLLLDWANKNDLTGEQLKKLLEAIYKYLPELKCNCNCQGDCDGNNTVHEGIIDIIS